ncbi:hydrolase [Planctobacterium marinum]|uniref:Alpha/beta hydrolase n=1 Tax=Planctobacterium marinum TaxID=1631968 RepID=A0AA48HJ70_9ALTE|nr:alpha/beta hydrolase [Planctobacterium marinum]
MIVTSEFKAPFWARNRHLQTIWPRFLVRKPKLDLHWEKLATPDDDFIELAWTKNEPSQKGLVVIFHGLEGSVDSHYAAHLMAMLSTQGWRGVLVHFRGCGPLGNQTARSYHSGETQDNKRVLEELRRRYPDMPFVGIGYSLGGNMLLKLLGEEPEQSWLQQAVAVSPPFDLARCSEAIAQGFSRVYQYHLLKSMRRKFSEKFHRFDYRTLLGLNLAELNNFKSFYQFDDKITGPLHGFKNALDYYQRCSANQFMQSIKTPTLVLHAKDDPFMTPDIVPHGKRISPSVRIELSERGGHVGFLQGSLLNPVFWVNERIKRALNEINV